MLNFYQSVRDALAEEQAAGNKYTSLAKEAPTEEERETLLGMARQEIMHKAHLECMLLGHEKETETKK